MDFPPGNNTSRVCCFGRPTRMSWPVLLGHLSGCSLPASLVSPPNTMSLRYLFSSAAIAVCALSGAFGWAPVPGHIMTKYAAAVDPNSVWAEYPRPQLVRSQWTNLNGLWNYAIANDQTTEPTQWSGQILVPFPLESSLSGVAQALQPTQALWYERQFTLSPPSNGAHVLLHFEAVDYITVVMVNGKVVGEHQGGYDPFTFDITNALLGSGTQDLIVKVIDTTGQGNYPYQPRGKQSLTPVRLRSLRSLPEFTPLLSIATRRSAARVLIVAC